MKQDALLSTLDLINLIASLSSIILAILALALSIIFYKWSDKSNKEIVNVAQAIDANTRKIENLFDRLYSDTFGMVKSNVEAMQKQLYSTSSFSSGDSELKGTEILEDAIVSIISKSKVVTKESIVAFIQGTHPKSEFQDSIIIETVNRLVEMGKLYLNGNLIAIGAFESKTAESQ